MKQVRTYILGLVLVLMTIAPLTGATVAEPEETEVGTEVSEKADAESVAVMTEAVQQSALILQLKQKLAQAQYRYYLLQSNVEQAKDGLEEVRDVIENLEEEVASLDALIKDTRKKILSVKSQIERKKMDLADLEEEVLMLEMQFEDQKAVVSELMTLLYVKQDIYYDDGEINTVKVLASPNSVSQTLQKLTYLDLIEAENQVQIEKMADLNEEMIGKWDEIREKRDELDVLDVQLAEELGTLKAERTAQETMLEEVQNEEMIYESMIEAADEREDDLLREIEIYEENVELMETKFSGTHGLLTEEQRDLIGKIEDDLAASFSVEDAADFLDLDWPVTPKDGLTAYFIDSNYQAVFGVQHHALDVRAKQGSTIFAPADGVVSSVVFDPDSSKYAYIRVAHRKGVMTVYGHVTAVAVEVGDYVKRDQILGLTGGMPGSTGAGVRTTGPHLHFEVWQDGVHVDPLKYLPLEQVPAEYLEAVQKALEAEILEIQAELGL